MGHIIEKASSGSEPAGASTRIEPRTAARGVDPAQPSAALRSRASALTLGATAGEVNPAQPGPSQSGLSQSALSHPVLARLLEEVRNEKRVDAAYDRVHHRHNRGR